MSFGVRPFFRASSAVRRVALLVLFILPLLVGLLPAAAAPVPAAVGPGHTYLALGDSLTTGSEAAGNNDGKPGYPAYLYDHLKGSSDLEFKLMGLNGETSTSMRAPGGQLDQALAFIEQERAAGRVVSPITLSIGGNDMVAVILGQTSIEGALSVFRTNFTEILDALLGAITVNGERTSDLVVMTYYNPYPGATRGSIVTDRDVPRFNAVIIEEAAARNIPVAPVFEAFQGKQAQYVFANLAIFPPTEKSLDYHPTEAGHQAIAAAFRETLGYTVEVKVYLPMVNK